MHHRAWLEIVQYWFDSLQLLFLSHVNPVAIRPRGSHSSYSFLPPSFDSSKTRTTSIDLVTSVPAIMRGIVREPVHSRSWCKRYLLVHCRRIAVATFSKCLGTETACNMSGTLRAGAVGEWSRWLDGRVSGWFFLSTWITTEPVGVLH